MIDALKQALEGMDSSMPGVDPSWLKPRREEAREKLGPIGFPSTREEEWRFTNMAPLLQLPLHAAIANGRHITSREIEPLHFAGAHVLVFVDGILREDLSSPPEEGVRLTVSGLQKRMSAGESALEKHLARHASFDSNFFTALNTAFFHDGAFISAPENAVIDRPVQLLFVAASERPGAMVQARNLIVAGANSQLKLIETYASLTSQPHVTNTVTELFLGPGASVEHCVLQNENNGAIHIAAIQAVQSKGSRWVSHSIATGAQIARSQIQTLLQGEGAEAILNGLYLAHCEQLIDHHTVVDHAAPRCDSHEFYHGILDGRSHGVFNGKIFVRPHAQKTSAKQTNRNLVLSENAVIDTKPQLEIFADDVKCTHGATVGQLNDEALFYLRSRGIGAVQARQMLIRAFAADIVARIGIEPVRQRLEQLLSGRFQNVEA